MHEVEKCSIFGVLPVKMKFVRFIVFSVTLSIVAIGGLMVLTFLNPMETKNANGEVEKDYSVAANSVMSCLIVVCLITLYAAWKRIPDLLLPYLLYKVLLILWLSLYLGVLVIDDKSALNFGPDIYPFRFLIEKETKVREDNTLFPVFLFILSLEIIALEIHTAIIVYRCRKSMLESSSLTISKALKKKRDEGNEATTNSQNHT